jgi:hypothetical protein
MRSIAIASLFVLVGTTAQAEIMCTNHRGCFETGRRIFRTGGAYSTPGMTSPIIAPARRTQASRSGSEGSGAATSKSSTARHGSAGACHAALPQQEK